jgi:predicted PurR-regulated permease PerM
MTSKTKRTLVRAGAGLASVLVLIWLMHALASVTTMVMVALVMAYILNPIVLWLTSLGLGRSTSAFLVILLGLSFVVAFILIVLPAMLGEVGRFVGQLPRYWSTLQSLIQQVGERLNLDIPRDWQEVTNLVIERGRQILPGLADYSSRFVSSLFKSTMNAISAFFYALMVPVIAYYLMVSFEEIKRGAEDLIPPYLRPQVMDKVRQIDSVLAAFVRGQLTVATVLGVLYSIGFLIIGIDLALLLGFLSGLLWIIPYVGTLFGLMAGSAMALAKFGDLLHVGYVVGWIGLVQVLEGYVLTPRIVGHAVGLHPVVYILALIVAANLFGFVGLLVAIPVTAAMKVLVNTGLDAYRKSYLYKDPAVEQDRR